MTLQDIVDATRDRLGNYEKPYYWQDREIVLYANEAQNEIARETRIFEDASTGSICNIHTAANVLDYDLSDFILYVNSARMYSSELMTLDVSPAPASFAANATVTGGTSAKTLKIVSCLTSTTYSVESRSGEFTLGEVLSDGTNSADQGAAYPTFADNSSSGWDLVKATTVEMNRLFSRWRVGVANKPIRYILDYRQGYITFFPPPDGIYTINLSVVRYPSAAFTATAMSSQTPEIPSQFHHVLVDGICYQAWLKAGENTYDAKKSQIHNGLFRGSIAKMKIKEGLYRANESTASPHRGFI